MNTRYTYTSPQERNSTLTSIFCFIHIQRAGKKVCWNWKWDTSTRGSVKLSGDHISLLLNRLQSQNRLAKSNKCQTELTFTLNHCPEPCSTCWATVASFENSWPWLTATIMMICLGLPMSMQLLGAKPHQHRRKRTEDRNTELPITSSVQENDNWKGPQFPESVNLYDGGCLFLLLQQMICCSPHADHELILESKQESQKAIVSYIATNKSCSPTFCFWATDLSLIVA